jgi:hypothetical protein
VRDTCLCRPQAKRVEGKPAITQFKKLAELPKFLTSLVTDGYYNEEEKNLVGFIMAANGHLEYTLLIPTTFFVIRIDVVKSIVNIRLSYSGTNRCWLIIYIFL